MLACVILGFFLPLRLLSAATAGDHRTDRFASEVRPVLERLCWECHAGEDAEAGVNLESLTTQIEAREAGRLWLRVQDVVADGTMPPAQSKTPSPHERQLILKWIAEDFLDPTKATPLPPPPVRRLNRTEYDNTIRDLTGLSLSLGADFPADDIAHGYDNIGAALQISPLHIESYLAAAERVVNAAILVPDATTVAPVELIGLSTYPLVAEQPVEFEHHLAPGRYCADLSLVRVGIAESVPPPRLVVGFGQDSRTLQAISVQDETVVYRFWLTVVPGDHQVHVSLAAQQPVPVAPEKQQVSANVSGDQRYGSNRGLHVDSIVARGPVPWPPTVAVNSTVETKLPAPHRRIMVCNPELGDAGRSTAGRQIITEFAELAYRRPVSSQEVEPLLALFHLADERGEAFERSIQIALTSVLVSPDFLLITPPTFHDDEGMHSDFVLANRLSYLLWSSMPDQALRETARDGTLRTQLTHQVHRMLHDEKANAFIQGFIGQWLQLRRLQDVRPDADLFPNFDKQLRAAMQRESEACFGYLLRENRSLLELIDADYTFANATLAQHYGFEGGFGDEFRLVTPLDGRRGGVLTQASILTLTSNPNRTSPVKRGQWILQQLLGTPPPPPPPNVKPLDESPLAAESASLRERLEQHRAKPECASCHRQMDPLGFALENFDPIGRWRSTDGEFPIDPSGQLSDSRTFKDVKDLKKLLKTDYAARFSRNWIENLWVYAMGRGVESSDLARLESIRRELEASDYRVQVALLAIVASPAFQASPSASELTQPQNQIRE